MAQGSLALPGSSGARVQRWGSRLCQSNLGAMSFWVTPGTELFPCHFSTFHLLAGKLSVDAEAGIGWHTWVTRWSLSQCTSQLPHVAACPTRAALRMLLPSCPLLNSSVAAIGSAHFSQHFVYSGVFIPLHSASSDFCCALWSIAAGRPRWECCTVTVQTSTYLHAMSTASLSNPMEEEKLFCVILDNCNNSAVQNSSTNILAVLWKSLCPFSHPHIWVGRKRFHSDSDQFAGHYVYLTHLGNKTGVLSGMQVGGCCKWSHSFNNKK